MEIAIVPLVAVLVLLIGVISAFVGRGRDIGIPGETCPHCGARQVQRDSASPWVFVFAALLFPLGLILFILNKNAWCSECRVRFKRG